MSELSELLRAAVAGGKRQIGQLMIFPEHSGHQYVVAHQDDFDLVRAENYDSLSHHRDPKDAYSLSTYDSEGEFRFTKGELSLQSGWVYFAQDASHLLRILNGFYGAAVALWAAQEKGTLRVQNLRDKLARQTGMYRFAGSISDEGAQQLIKDYCGPSNKCVKKILWDISEELPLEDSEASRFEGVLGEKSACIPMLCQEACNFVVSKARIVAKKEFEAKNA